MTGRKILEVVNLADLRWGALIRMYNGHVLQFVVTENGTLSVTSSVPSKGSFHKDDVQYDDAYVSTGTGKLNLWKSGTGTELGVLLNAFVEAGCQLVDLPSDA